MNIQPNDENSVGRFFHGSPCIVCSQTLRYISNRSCVDCEARRMFRVKVKRVKKRRMTLFFEGRPCRVCAGTRRYASDNACLACRKRKDAERWAVLKKQALTVGTV